MDINLKESLWKQFGASIDMVENALILYQSNIGIQIKSFGIMLIIAYSFLITT